MNLNVKMKFYNEFPKALAEGKVAVFAGAGISKPCGFVDWKGLLKKFADEIGLDVEKENDLILLSQYYKNESGGNRCSFNQEIINAFTKGNDESELLKIIASLPVQSFWTTNYDKTLEKSLEKVGKIVDIKLNNTDFTLDKPNATVTLYKMHGDVNCPYEAVLCKDDYDKYNYTHQSFITALLGDLATKTFIFLGYSLSDPDFNHILSEIRIQLGENTRNHFLFVKKISKNDDKYLYDGVFQENIFKYDEIKQSLQIQELLRFGIHTILVNVYEDIDKMLLSVFLKYQLNKVFVAGKCVDFGANTDQHIQEKIIFDVGYKLIENGFMISTGMSEGTGIHIVNGALNAISNKNLSLEKYLRIKRLPLVNGSANHMDKKVKELYQNDMVSEVGVVLFMYGNSYYDAVLKDSEGTWHDYERARKQNKIIIPIASTGYASERILDDMINHIDDFYYIKPFLKLLKSVVTADEIVDLIKNIILHVEESISRN